MAEPPHVWTGPDDEPDGQRAPVPPTTPMAKDPVVEPGRQPSGWGVPPDAPAPAAQPNQWGSPPAQPDQWGGAPVQPNQWGGPPAQPNQWGGHPAPGPWGGAPTPGTWTSRGPGIVPLRPLSIFEIYDGAIRAIRANPRTMVGYSAIVIALLTLLATAPQAFALAKLVNSPLLDPATAENAEFGDIADLVGAGAITLVIGVLQFVLATTIISGLLIVAVDGAVRGQALHPAQLWARCRSRLLAVLGLAVVVLLALPVVLLVALVPGLLVIFLTSATVLGVILLVLGSIAGTLGYVALYFGFWAVGAPALLLENLGVVTALQRSYRLVRGSFWRVFGIGLLTALIAYIVRQLFSVPFSLVGGLVAGTQDSTGFTASLIQLLITDIGTVLAGAVLFPFTAAVAALLYLDLRMRREGLDVDLMRS